MSSYNARIIEKNIMADVLAVSGGDSEIIDLNGASKFSYQGVYTEIDPVPEDFDSPQFAVLVNQGLTLTALTAGAAGNLITLTMIDPEDDNVPLSIETTGNNIVVTLETDGDGIIVTDVDDLVALINGEDPGAADLVLASGTGSSAVTALVQTALEDGSDGAVSVADSTINVPDHGYVLGQEVELSTDGTLPDPLATSTAYYVIIVDANTIQLAASLEDAIDGTFIELTDTGADGSVNTITITAFTSATLGFYKSNNQVDWVEIAAPTAITGSGSQLVSVADVSYRYFKAIKTIDAGALELAVNVLVVGDAI